MRIRLLIILFCLCSVMPLSAAEITAVSPSTAAVGTSVTLSGGPFVSGDNVLIGDRRVAASTLTATSLTFILPALPSGEYALAVERAGVRSTHAFLLRVVQPPPRIALLSPATLDSCTLASERQVTVNGSHFRPGAQLLLDNTVLAIDKLATAKSSLPCRR